MSLWLVVWFTVSLVVTVALIAVLLAVIRSAKLVSRTAGRFADEAQPITDDISRGSDRAKRRIDAMKAPTGRGKR
jgi:hypothetical protein